ncbi:hypothetical protein TNCV_690251 [Trichonephila clavipes]|nr:hypothetical protein TNCV_690251 [Trichonephila clavipes]
MSGSASSQHDLPPVKSAGLSLPEQWNHELGSVKTLFATKGFHLWLGPLIRAASRAPISSNLGRDNLFRGATRLLDVTRSTLTLSLCLTLKKAAAPYAFDWHQKRYGFGLHLNLHWNRGSFAESLTLIKMEVLTTIVTILHEYLAVARHPRITFVAKVLVIGI